MDFVVIGVFVIDLDGLLFDYDYCEVKVIKMIIDNVWYVILVVDSMKFEWMVLVWVGYFFDVIIFVID